MSVSIDGKAHIGVLEVKYGETFPNPRRSMELHNEEYGKVLVYIISTGVPEWTEKMTVNVPIKYYITDIMEPNKRYRNKQKIKKIGLRVLN